MLYGNKITFICRLFFLIILQKNPTDSLFVLFASGTSFYKICVKFFSDMFFSIILSVLPNEFRANLVFHTLGYDMFLFGFVFKFPSL